MPRRHITFRELLPYHIINGGVSEKGLFRDLDDYYRFIYQLYAANFGSPGDNLTPQKVVRIGRAILAGREVPEAAIGSVKPPLVYILHFAVMPNHFHLNLVQRAPGGIQQFMQKLSTGFAKYYNAKYEESGNVFLGRYRAEPLVDEETLLHTGLYIHTTPLDLFSVKWRESGVSDTEKAVAFLSKYPWSSYPDFLGLRSSHVLCPPKIRRMFIKGEKMHKKDDYTNFMESYRIFGMPSRGDMHVS